MEFEAAVKALSSQTWDWSRPAFEATLAKLGLKRKPRSAKDAPIYTTPWGDDMQVWFEGDRAVRAELMFDVTEPETEFDEEEYDELQTVYCDKWQAYTKRAAKLLRKPAFADGMANDAFPEDLEAVWLALWPLETARFMVIQNSGEHEIPFWMAILLTPPV